MNQAETFRQNVMKLERSWITDDIEYFEKVTPEVRHFTGNGVYCREMTMKRGMIGIGAIHKKKHVCIISKGFVSVFDETGRTDIHAPYSFISLPGTKRVLVAHEDTVWTTVHETELTDIAELERELVTDTYDALEYNGEQQCLFG